MKNSQRRDNKIRIAKGLRNWSFDPNDWEISPNDLILRHTATQLTFEIGFDDANADKTPAANTYAVLLRSPGDERQHSAETLQEFGELAIVLYLVAKEELDYKWSEPDEKQTRPAVPSVQ